MADVLGKLEPVVGPLLQPGETLLGGCKCAGMNAALKAGLSAGGGVIGDVAGSALGSGAGSGGYGAAVPQVKVFWIAVTNLRLIYFSVGALTSGPKKYAGEAPISTVQNVVIKPGKIFRRFTIVFTDGTQATVDAYRASNPDSLQESLARVLPQ
ncbi:hypothetical protein [Jatrophihabitans fulvus]